MNEDEYRDQQRERSGRDSHYTLGMGSTELTALIATQRMMMAMMDKAKGGNSASPALADIPNLNSVCVFFTAIMLTGKMSEDAALGNAIQMVEEIEAERTQQLIQAITKHAAGV